VRRDLVRRIAGEQNPAGDEMLGKSRSYLERIEGAQPNRWQVGVGRSDHLPDSGRHLVGGPAVRSILRGIEIDLTAPIVLAVQRAEHPFGALLHIPQQDGFPVLGPPTEVRDEMRVDERIQRGKLDVRNIGGGPHVAAGPIAADEPPRADAFLTRAGPNRDVHPIWPLARAGELRTETDACLGVRRGMPREQGIRLVLADAVGIARGQMRRRPR
jgi:hypothetical protein